jgi:predicted nucleic acid-binding protein
VVAAVTRRGGKDRALDALEMIERLGIETVGFDREQAVTAAFLRVETGLGSADSAAAALAALDGVLVTSDEDFKRVGKKIKIHWLR